MKNNLACLNSCSTHNANFSDEDRISMSEFCDLFKKDHIASSYANESCDLGPSRVLSMISKVSNSFVSLSENPSASLSSEIFIQELLGNLNQLMQHETTINFEDSI